MTPGCATHIRSSSRCHHASSDDRDPLRSRSITRTHLDGPNQHLKIGRWIAPHEEPRSTCDRGSIVARSWRIQSQNGAVASRNQRGVYFQPNRRTIMPRSRSITVDRGENRGEEEAEIMPKIEAN